MIFFYMGTKNRLQKHYVNHIDVHKQLKLLTCSQLNRQYLSFSLSICLFILLSTLLRRIKHMKGEATLLVKQPSRDRAGCYFLSVIFFTGRLCDVNGNWTESKRMKTLIRVCIVSVPDFRFSGKSVFKV